MSVMTPEHTKTMVAALFAKQVVAAAGPEAVTPKVARACAEAAAELWQAVLEVEDSKVVPFPQREPA